MAQQAEVSTPDDIDTALPGDPGEVDMSQEDADALLSELADGEIRRMIGDEAEERELPVSEPPPASPPAAAWPPAAAVQAAPAPPAVKSQARTKAELQAAALQEALADQLDQLYSELISNEPEPQAQVDVTALPDEPDQLDLTDIADAADAAAADEPPAAQAYVAAAHTPPVEAEASTEPEAESGADAKADAVAAELDLDAQLSREADKLLKPLKADAAPAEASFKPHADGAADAEPAAKPARPPLLLLPLWLLNWPVMHLPHASRNALGKVAIVTILNAVAVLVYVLLFRRT